jgi:SAM-dependent methyltransferase
VQQAPAPGEATHGTTVPTLPPGRSFTRELTPTWLATAALLAGQRPPDLAAPQRWVHLGCGTGETAAVVAAAHPHAEVWAWDPELAHLEATRRLAEAAGLDNVVVHEHRDLPLDLGGGPADVIVVQDVLVAASDAERDRIAAAVDATLRPGGLLCTTYATLVGWAEVAPVQSLLRRLVAGRPDPASAAAGALATVQRLREGGARFLAERPVVTAWLDHLAQLPVDELVARYLRGPFRPMSPAQVAATFAGSGCARIGSARLADDLDLPAGLRTAVDAAPDEVVRETYRDLAARRTYRLDLHRRGRAPLADRDRDERVAALGLAGLASPDEAPAVPMARDAWRRLTSFGTTAGALHDDPAGTRRSLRLLLDAGQAHPIVSRGPGKTAVEACDALNAVLAADPRPDRAQLRAVALLGSAVGADRSAVVRGMPPRREGTPT